jgi:formamidopyrimidine-DNA glycosylase
MPELPEVEYAAARLAGTVIGKQVVAARALHPALARCLPAIDAERLVGLAIVAVERRGKYQLLQLDDDIVLVAHFRMAGDWHVGPAGDPPGHARAVLEFADGTALFLVDARALATLVVRARGGEGLPQLGPDAASPTLTGALLRLGIAGRRTAIKPLLLDQRVVAGLGNIYAAEALWRAELSPFARPDALGDDHLDRLADAIGATLGDARRDPGRYSRGDALARLAVYGRAGEACSRCGEAVARVVQAGRSTYFCSGCQRGGMP